MITRESILRATHYGADIYAHIIRVMYPEDESVMTISGRDCGICRNPFAKGAKTLHVWIEKLNTGQEVSDEMALHEDIRGTIKPGDALNFASLFYNKEGQDLLTTINAEMCLKLDVDPKDRNCRNMPETSTKNEVRFSFYKAPITNINPYKAIRLADAYNYITGMYARERTYELRGITDKSRARNFKAARFDYCTFSGIFEARNEKKLIEHSGLLCLDFDHVNELEYLFKRLLEDEYFETKLLFRSPSGDGLKWIIPINIAEASHSNYFKSVANYIRKTYGVDVDQSGKDVARACFLPYDPKAYFDTNLNQK